jgi:hypothetical protein
LRSNKGAAQRPGSYEKSYRDYLIHQLAGLIYEAKSNLQPARMRVGMGQCDIGVNRRQKTVDGQIILGENPSGPVDRTVGVCRIETAAGQPLATLVNFATHPVGQDVQVRKVSADYVGCMRRVVQDATGAPCLFWQGACGNINILSAETDYANVCARGTRLGQEVTRVWEAAQPIQSEEIRLVSRQLKLPPYCCLSREHAEQKRQEAQRDLETARKDPKSTPGLIAWLERDVKRLADLRDSWTNPALVPPPVEAQLQACRIGDLAWVCVPGELFNELGTEIKSRSPFRHTFVVAYANDWIGYLPTRQAFEEGGYEVSQVCYLSPEAIQMMVEEFVTMLGDLAKDPRADQT